jgi:hypothetical protein
MARFANGVLDHGSESHTEGGGGRRVRHIRVSVYGWMSDENLIRAGGSSFLKYEVVIILKLRRDHPRAS